MRWVRGWRIYLIITIRKRILYFAIVLWHCSNVKIVSVYNPPKQRIAFVVSPIG